MDFGHVLSKKSKFFTHGRMDPRTENPTNEVTSTIFDNLRENPFQFYATHLWQINDDGGDDDGDDGNDDFDGRTTEAPPIVVFAY